MGNNYNFILTEDQARTIAEHFGKNFEDLTELEIDELLDRVIDEL